MAYIGNQLSWLAGTLAGFGAPEGQNAIFFYANSTDSLATVLGANYISDGQKRGLQNLGNIVFFFDGTNVFPLVVTALQANASGYGVTLSQWEDTGAIGATNAAYHAATNTTSFTATAAQVTGGEAFVELDCTGAGSTGTVTMPTVAAIVAALGISEPGQSWGAQDQEHRVLGHDHAGGRRQRAVRPHRHRDHRDDHLARLSHHPDLAHRRDDPEPRGRRDALSLLVANAKPPRLCDRSEGLSERAALLLGTLADDRPGAGINPKGFATWRPRR